MTSSTTYTYDANGNVISENIDKNSDGTTDSVITYSYNRTVESFDENFESIVSIYTYDANGNQTSRRAYVDGQDILYSFETRTYDANGNKTSESFDNNGDGKLDTLTIV
ncbi:hypothetical protein [uncultured Nostoc sp.]|uniref:hypothetical protein n=1 Tax=uncultured Nostoc sp. TaxID=340711 RepID=UPI0035C9478F